MLVFKSNNEEITTSDYQMASFEVVYDRVKKDYIKRFTCQMQTNSSNDIINFLNDRLDGFVDVVHSDGFSLLEAKVVFINADIKTNICRVEVQQGLE